MGIQLLKFHCTHSHQSQCDWTTKAGIYQLCVWHSWYHCRLLLVFVCVSAYNRTTNTSNSPSRNCDGSCSHTYTERAHREFISLFFFRRSFSLILLCSMEWSVVGAFAMCVCRFFLLLLLVRWRFCFNAITMRPVQNKQENLFWHFFYQII